MPISEAQRGCSENWFVKQAVSAGNAIKRAGQSSVGVVNQLKDGLEPLDKTAKFVVAADKVFAAAGKGFTLLSLAAKPMVDVVLVDDGFNPFLTLWPLLNGEFSKLNAVGKAWVINLLAIQTLALAKVGEIVFHLYKMADLSALVGQVPVIGGFLGNISFGAIMQPLVISLSVLGICKSVSKLNSLKDPDESRAKLGRWKDIKSREDLLAEITTKKNVDKYVKKELVFRDVDNQLYLVDGKRRQFVDLVSKKLVKYSDRLHNDPIERKKAWASLAVDVIKIVAAISSLVAIIALTVGCAPAALLITCAAISLGSATFQLGKLGYSLWLTSQLQKARPVVVPNFAIA